MLKKILLPLLYTNLLFAQSTIEIKPMTWENLQEFQKDNLMSIESLNLSTSCPKTLTEFTELKKNFAFHHKKTEKIMGSYFKWTEFYKYNREICVVRHVKNHPNLKEIPLNPEKDVILSAYEARILMSAEAEYGFERKNISNKLFEEKLLEIRKKEEKIIRQKFKVYGGIKDVISFMKIHKSNSMNELFTYEFIKSNKNLPEYPNPIHPPNDSILVLNYFEKNYSNAQKQALIEQTIIKNTKNHERILSYSKSDLELLENSWSLISIKDTNSSRKNILEKSSYKIKFDKETMKFFGSGLCNTRSGRFILNKDNFYLIFGFSHHLACSYFKEVEHPKEELYQLQTKSIKNIIKLVIGYEIKNSELILFTRDSRKLFFKKVSS